MVMVRGTTTIQEYTGGPKRVRGGLFKPKGTTGPAKVTQEIASVGGLWDLGRQSSLVKGTYTASWGSSNYASSATTPVTGYPITVAGWCRITAGSTSRVVQIDSGSNNDRVLVLFDGSTNKFSAFVSAGGSGTNTFHATAVGTGWHFVACVWASSTSRTVYVDGTSNTGNTTSSAAPATLTTIRVGADAASGGSSGFEAGLFAVYPGAATTYQIDAMALGEDPGRVLGPTCQVWPMDNSLASRSGSYNLTATGTVTAQNKLIVVRDLSGNKRHVRATTAPPTYSSTQGNGQGGGAFDSASSQFLVFDGSVPDVAPFQVYAVARTTTTAARGNVWWLGDKDSSNDSWSVEFDGTNALNTGDDRIVFTPFDTNISPISGTTYSADTDYVIWALESSSTSRAVQVNGTNQATGSYDRSPDGADRFALGRYSAATPSVHLDGQIHYVILLTTASTHAKSRIEKFLAGAFGITLS